MIHAAGSFIHYQRRRNLPIFTGNKDVLKYPIDFENLPPFTGKIFPWVSPGRWVLFCVPTFPPILFVPFYIQSHWTYFSTYLDGNYKPAIIAFCMTYIADMCICIILAMAMSWVFVNKRFQDEKRSEGTLNELSRQSEEPSVSENNY